MERKVANLEVLEGLHRWFEGLCKYGSEAWADRMYAEGQIFACREALGNFEYRYKAISRGFEMKSEESFVDGYEAFQRDYKCDHVRYKV